MVLKGVVESRRVTDSLVSVGRVCERFRRGVQFYTDGPYVDSPMCFDPKYTVVGPREKRTSAGMSVRWDFLDSSHQSNLHLPVRHGGGVAVPEKEGT